MNQPKNLSTTPDPHALLEGEDVVVDVAVVAYNSADTLRGCVEPLTRLSGVRVTVVDNQSPDDSIGVIADLDAVNVVRAPRNGGFGYGCNLGAAQGSAPFLLFLNPDARIDTAALATLLDVARSDETVGLVGPRILDDDGSLAYSVRRFPRLRSTYAKALFLHRAWPRVAWTDELVRDPAVYERADTAEWVSGACMLVRRDAFERLGGFDEDLFLYCEDTDICLRLWQAGLSVRFEPSATVRHVGGASSGVGETQAIAARSRIHYARKHRGPLAALLERIGVALDEATHALANIARPASRRGHLRALHSALVG